MNTKPKRTHNAPIPTPKPARTPAVKPTVGALLPEPLPAPERIERENDLA